MPKRSQDAEIINLIPMDTSELELGRYASFDVSPEPMFGPDELGDQLTQVVNDLCQSATKAESAARIFEVLQRWEARLFDRNYQHITSGTRGWSMGSGTPQSIMANQNGMKLFPFNIYGARKDKIAAALSREIPPLKFTPNDPDFPEDQVAAESRDKYMEIWLNDTNAKRLLSDIGGLQYTDDRVCLWTASWADEQRWGTESADKDDRTEEPVIDRDAESEDEQVPEEEAMPAEMGRDEQPAICEITKAFGVLEHKVSLIADDENDIGYLRIAYEVDQNISKERYSWIEDKIQSGGGLVTGGDQFDRLARMNIRLAVQNSTVSGESWQRDVTETHSWFRPSQYRSIKDRSHRATFRKFFPNGLRVTHAGSQLAFIRNESMNDHIKIVHSRQGSGQNRRAIGSNLLPIQKILNSNMTLINRYFVGCVPRRFALGAVNVAAMNAQGNDPSRVTEIMLDGTNAQTLDQITSVEKVPIPSDALMQFVQWLCEGAPELLDGASAAMFGTEDSDTYGQARLNRDQALQVFGTPWSEICWGLAGAAQQAANCASQNRVTAIRGRTPSESRISVDHKNLKGRAMCYPQTLDIPETLAEAETRMGAIFEQADKVQLYAAIANDPLNWIAFEKFVRIRGVKTQQCESVKKQQGEFEELLTSPPMDNPAYMQAEQQAQMFAQQSAGNPEAQTPEGQQALQQMQQALQAIPKLITSVPVAQDSSENHEVEALACWAKMNSEEGRKLKNGDEEKKSFYQNLVLHWQGHEEMKQKLTPVKPLEVKANASIAIDKLPSNVQAQALQAMGVQAKPEDFMGDQSLMPHEVVTEKEGVDANGVPVKQKISMAGKGLQ